MLRLEPQCRLRAGRSAASGGGAVKEGEGDGWEEGTPNGVGGGGERLVGVGHP